jgi:hypothetical protein
MTFTSWRQLTLLAVQLARLRLLRVGGALLLLFLESSQLNESFVIREHVIAIKLIVVRTQNGSTQ